MSKGQPIKEGLEFYPMYYDYYRMGHDMARARYKAEGFMMLTDLYSEIFGHHGYYFDLSEDSMRLDMFCSKYNHERKRVEEFIDFCVKQNIFDRTRKNKHKILTSLNIQKIWFSVVKRRVEIRRTDKYLYKELIEAITILEEKRKNEQKDVQNRGQKPERKGADNQPNDQYMSTGSQQDAHSTSTPHQHITDKGREAKRSEAKRSSNSENFQFSSLTSSDSREGEDVDISSDFNEKMDDWSEDLPETEKSDENTASIKKEKNSAKKETKVHPCRAAFINAHQRLTGVVYVQNKADNAHIRYIVNAIDKNFSTRVPPDDPDYYPKLGDFIRFMFSVQNFESIPEKERWGDAINQINKTIPAIIKHTMMAYFTNNNKKNYETGVHH